MSDKSGGRGSSVTTFRTGFPPDKIPLPAQTRAPKPLIQIGESLARLYTKAPHVRMASHRSVLRQTLLTRTKVLKIWRSPD